MDLTMSIAAMSVDMNSTRAVQDMSMAIMKMAMNSETAAVENMLESIDVSAITGVGGNIDMVV